jgi:fructokinase
MRKIYGIGESLFDIIFKDGAPQTAKAGGSVLNSMVSMGRIGLPVSFISEYGQDDVGNLIDVFLKNNGVDTSTVHRYKDGNTALALAFLDDKNDAHYTFYKDYPRKRLETELPEIRRNDIVQCGSFYAIWPEIREKFRRFIKSAGDNGGLVLYDPNFRKSHISDLEELKPLIIENMEMAGIVRGSDEDFSNIFGAGNADEAWKIVSKYCKCMIYTSSSAGVFVRTPSFKGKFQVRKIKPLSTIGAGDNFNAGVISSIYKNQIQAEQIEHLTEKEWALIISTAVDFATEVCLSYENYISRAFASRYFSASRDHI